MMALTAVIFILFTKYIDILQTIIGDFLARVKIMVFSMFFSPFFLFTGVEISEIMLLCIFNKLNILASFYLIIADDIFIHLVHPLEPCDSIGFSMV